MRQVEQGEESDQFYQELEEQELATLKRHIRGRKGARWSRSNSETDAMYKQALMDSIFGRFQEASRKLKLMITLVPDNPEPYHLLGTMHQQNGELDKASQYLFMSTYLSPPNLEKWLKVGDLSFERKMFSQAAYCYGRALKIASCDPTIMVRRAQAFEAAGQSKKAIATYKRLLSISNSPQYLKKYAKLRFRRGEYVSCRELLKSMQNFISDPHLVFMICETYLKQAQYAETAVLLESHLSYREQQLHENEELPAQFLLILLICCVALQRECYGLCADVLLQESKQCYQDQYAQFYSEAVTHLSRFNEEYTYKMAHFLLGHKQHQTVKNYILVTDYLCRNKNSLCLSVLQESLKMHPYSPELLAQRDYIHKCFGIGNTLRESEAIYYSDDDQPVPSPPVAHHKRNNEQVDSQVLVKLIQNINQSIKILLEEIKQGNSPGIKQFQTVVDSLDFFISLTPGTKQTIQQKEGLYLRKVTRRRTTEGESRSSAIYDHIDNVIKYFEGLLVYLQNLLSHKQWRKLYQIGERVSKVHVFKNHNNRNDFTVLKIRIFQISVLGCLAVNKFNTALFFLRYLAAKNPEDSLYILSMHLLMRICSKKTFLSSALSKRLTNPGGQYLARLLAIQYMQTGCFDLAASALLRSSQVSGSLSGTPQLCLAACLIQIASSRNTYNKLDYTNRSALCLASYQEINENKWQSMFNRGRWFAQVKLNHKAIKCFQKLLNQQQAEIGIKERAAYCLICIYKDCQLFQKANNLSSQYFPIPEIFDENAKEQLVS